MKITRVEASWLQVPVPEERQHVSDFGRATTCDMALVRIETDAGITGVGEAKVSAGGMGDYLAIDYPSALAFEAAGHGHIVAPLAIVGGNVPVGGSETSGMISRPRPARRTRTSAATYFRYSDRNSRNVALLVHHGSSRHFSPTTA